MHLSIAQVQYIIYFTMSIWMSIIYVDPVHHLHIDKIKRGEHLHVSLTLSILEPSYDG